MPDEQGEGPRKPTGAALKQRIAALARNIAGTEEHLASTFDQMAERDPARAGYLNAVAAEAREHAESERQVAVAMSDDDAIP